MVHQQTRTAKAKHVPKLLIYQKSDLHASTMVTVSKLGVGPPQRGAQKFPFMQRVLSQHGGSCENMSGTPSATVFQKLRGHIKENLSNVSEACLGNGDMSTIEMNGLHFLISLSTMGNEPAN